VRNALAYYARVTMATDKKLMKFTAEVLQRDRQLPSRRNSSPTQNSAVRGCETGSAADQRLRRLRDQERRTRSA
jgi:hypothetical protein